MKAVLRAEMPKEDVKGEGEAEGVKRISDVEDERGLFRRTMS